MQAEKNKKKERQAVVIIHGMGEQRPMDTLRNFAQSIKNHLSKTDATEKTSTLRSKPDGVSATYETRMLSLSATKNRPIIDFYEFYWAHNMRDTTFGHTTNWLSHLVFISPKKVPPRQLPLYYTIWVIIILLLAAPFVLWFVMGIKETKFLFTSLVAIPSILFLLGIVQKHISNLFLSTAGDAARYFNPIPSNIEQRNTIRRQGIDFLKQLHKDEKYDRVIVVAHSLGTAVAYDLLRLLWTEYNECFEKKATINQDAVKDLNAFAKEPATISDIDSFQTLQNTVWQEWRNTGNPWLITDFITLGAAVCSIDYLYPTKQKFSTLTQEREFPTCPPVVDEKDHTIYYNSDPFEVVDGSETKKRTVKHLHHAALFAITRWTNIFFTSDFVGSPAKRIFNNGVKDVPLARKSLWIIPGGHTNYWDAGSDKSLEAIVNALKLRREDPK
jgi:hypothetical protein